MKKGVLLFFMLALLQGCVVPAKFSSVTVLDSEFNEIKVLTRSEIEEFEAYWYNFKGIKKLPDNITSDKSFYRIDIVAEKERFSGRWIYYSSGYMAKLNKSLSPAFIVENSSDVTRSLGI